MSDIPLARDMLKCVADDLRDGGDPVANAAAIEMIVRDWMYRTQSKPRAPVKSVPMNSLLGSLARMISRQHPDRSTQQIADSLGVNPGRVSEAIAGKW